MRKEHLKYLCCPITKESLRLSISKEDENNEVLEGKLISSAYEYPIIKGIPRFVFKEKKLTEKTVKSFGYQWKLSKKISLNYGIDDDYFNAFFSPLDPNEFINKIVLDAGCGNGRLIEYSLKFSPELIVGVDYSEAIELAYERTKLLDNVLLIQADITKLPIKESFFDYIYSLGVIHHILEPKKAINSLRRTVKKDGNINFWVYSKEGNKIYLFFYKIISFFTKKINDYFKWILSLIISVFIYPYMKVCVLLSKISEKNFLPLQEYMKFISGLGFKILRLVIYDQLIPQIAYYPTKEELLNWVDFDDLKISHLDMRTNNSWRIGLRKIK